MDHTSITVDKSERTNDIVAVSCTTSFLAFIGASEFFSLEMWRATVTELIATAALMFSLTTCIISCLESNGADPKLLVPTAVFINIFLFLLVTVPLTGGHMNPIFTFIATLKGATSPTRALVYVPAQCIGSIIGFITIKAVMSHEAARKYSLGGCALGGGATEPGLGTIAGLGLEFVCTFLVLLIGVTVAFDRRRCRELGLVVVCGVVALAVAVALFLSITVTGRAGYAGVGLNPARCLGAALVQGGGLWDGHWVFWVGPFLACLVYYGISLNMPRKDIVWFANSKT